MRIALSTLTAALAASSCLIAQAPNDFQQDFEVAIRTVAANYAYFDAKATRWEAVPALYAADLRDVKNRDEFIALLERVLDELYRPACTADRQSGTFTASRAFGHRSMG